MDKTPTSNRFAYKRFYRRNLPHIQPVDADLFVTFRLADSLPTHVLQVMREERQWRQEIRDRNKHRSVPPSNELMRRHFAIMEKYLDSATTGPKWLLDSQVADIVHSALLYRDGKIYRLDAFSIMPNHVHVVFRSLTRGELPISLSSIMHSLKRNTAKQANSVLDRLGKFWAHESFDHYIRDANERKRIIHYTLQNPVKAGLVKCWQDWPWNYVRELW